MNHRNDKLTARKGQYYDNSLDKSIIEANMMQARAKELRLEVRAMELALLEKRKDKELLTDEIIAEIFSPLHGGGKEKSKSTTTAILTDARIVADRLKHGAFSRQQILSVVNRLMFFERYQEDADSVDQDLDDNVDKAKSYIIKEEQKYNETTVSLWLGQLLQASVLLNQQSSMNPKPPSSVSTLMTNGKLEKIIQSRILELRQMRKVERNRKIAAEINRIAAISNRVNRTITTLEEGKISSFIPMWVPSSFVPYILSLNGEELSSSSSDSPTTSSYSNLTTLTATDLGKQEVEILKNDVLMGSRFYVTSFESIPGAALFRGNIRTSLRRVPSSVVIGTNDCGIVRDNKGNKIKKNNTNQNNAIKDEIHIHDNNTAMVFADIQERLDKAGLGEKVQLFLLPEKPIGRPVILALPKALSPDESKLKKSWIRKIVKVLCYPLAALSTFIYSFSMHVLNPNFFNSLVYRRDLTVLYSCIPLILGVVAVQTIHEAAHYLVARRRNIKIGRPVPIPSLHIASFPFFGCITPLKSFPPDRAASLDFALCGPMASITLSLGFVLGGIFLTSRASVLDIARFPVISVANMKSSFFLGSILSCFLPKTMMLPSAQPIPMHPLFMVGTSGLISSALNILPIFRLDGGRACSAVMGRVMGHVISIFTILWLISLIVSGASSILLSWTILISLLQLRMEIPCRDECTEVDGKRLWIWLISVVLSMSILVPFPR